jgi:hypothetical protein
MIGDYQYEDHYGSCKVCREAEADAIGREGELCPDCEWQERVETLLLAAGIGVVDYEARELEQ